MTTPAFDVTHTFISRAPSGGQLAGYDTGSGGIAWTAADWAAHPGALHIDQDVAASDGTADVLDVEAGAATPADCPGWAKRAQAAFRSGTRPGQRAPAIYTSASNVGAVVNALVAGGVTSGVGLWVANWNLTSAQAVADVKAAAGPFPVIGVQYADTGGGGTYDLDQFSAAWLANVSGKAPVPAPAPTVLAFPLTQGESGTQVKVLQANLNRWASVIGLTTNLAADGSFGPLTAAAVTLAQEYFGEHGVLAGTCSQAVYDDLAAAVPAPAPAPTPAPVPAPVTGTQASWARCGQCQALFDLSAVASSRCPAGGAHQRADTYSYALNYSQPA